MLNALNSLTNGSILVFDNSTNFSFDNLSNKKIILFSSSQFISSITNKPEQLVKSFILDEHTDKVQQEERFDNSEDLIFQLADELYRCYKHEASDDSKSGDANLAKEKEEIANRIHSELKKAHQRFSTNVSDHDKSPISTKTALVWLEYESNNEDVGANMQKRFGDILSSISTFKDQEECFCHVCTNEHDNTVFLIIDGDYKDSAVVGLSNLRNVKKIYSCNRTSSTNKTSVNNHNDLYFQLTHDLIAHYNKLGSDFNARKEAEKAKEMFLKAHQLCKIILEL